MITRMESLSYVECLKRHSFLSLENSDTGKVSKEGIFPVCCTVRMRRCCTKCLGNDLKEKKEGKKKRKKKRRTLVFPSTRILIVGVTVTGYCEGQKFK